MTHPNWNPTNPLLAMAVTVRPDIRWISYPDIRRWVAQDPISNAFFYFSELEHDAARMLNGSRDLGQIARILNRRALNRPITITWLELLVQKLHRSDLLLPIHGAVGAYAKPFTHQGNLAMRIAANPLAIRIPLLKPSEHFPFARFLANLIFHPMVALLGAILLAGTSFLLLARWLHRPEQLFYDLSHLQGDRWLALIVMLLVIKSLHELGHYLATVRWKTNCHEIGLLLLCFSPCLYCDTTDAWKLASKWHRAAISAAGIYVELWIAVLGGLVFLNTDSGLWHTLGAGAFLTCTVGTMLINGNPCFRYDGYYILSDIWEVPNLSSQSSEALWVTFVSLLGGRKPDPSRFDRPIWQLALFAFVSSIYRVAVLGLLAAFLWTYLVPLGFGIVALFLFASLALGISLTVFRTLQATVAEFFGPNPIRAIRFLVFVALMVIAVIAASVFPLPNYALSRGFTELRKGRPVFAADTSVLKSVGQLNGPMRRGDLLFETDLPEKRIELLDAQRQLAELKARIRILENTQVTDEASAFELPALRVLLRECEARLKILDGELEALHQIAPEDGYFVAHSSPIPLPYKDGQSRNELGFALNDSQLGMVLERGQLVGWFTPDYEFVVHAIVPEADARWVEIGMHADAILDGRTFLRSPCTVASISPEPLTEFPPELMGDSSLIAVRDETGRLRLDSPHYLVVLVPTSHLPSALRGSRLTVHFQFQGKTVLQSLMEIANRSLRVLP